MMKVLAALNFVIKLLALVSQIQVQQLLLVQLLQKASEPRSLLSVLRAPKPSDLARKRRVTSNPPTGKN